MTTVANVAFRWRPTTAPPAGRYDDIGFIDESTGWAVNSNGQILKTTNAGATWTVQRQLPGTYPRCLGFANAQKGWVGTTAAPRRLFQTADGGANWTLVENLPPQTPVKICGLSVVNEHVIYGSGTNVPGDGPAMLKSVDGGATWSAWNMSAHATILIDCFFPDPQRGWVVGGKANVPHPTRNDVRPVVLLTEDGGQTWVDRLAGLSIDFPFGEWGWKIQFLDDRVGFVSLENFSAGATLKTTDGGNTWVRLPLNDPQRNANLEGIGFLDENHGWVGGWGDRLFQSGKSSETLDGGQTWQDANEIGKYINRFRFVGTPLKVAYASGQTVYKYSTQPVPAPVLARDRAPRRLLESSLPCECDDQHAICFHVPPGAQTLRIDVWDRFAAEVGSVATVDKPAPGRWSIPWDFTDSAGNPLPPGHYLYRITIDEQAESRLVLLRRRSAAPRTAAAALVGHAQHNVRKNIYDLSETELGDFIEAVLRLKRSRKYDNYPRLHRDAMLRATPVLGEPFDSAIRNAAHSGPVFLPWHREFLRRFELDLQSEVPGVTLPYWDWSADAALPDPARARLWTPAYVGVGGTSESGYEVLDGPFVRANWPIPADLDGPVLRRRLAVFETVRPDCTIAPLPVALPTRAEVDELLNERVYDSPPWGRLAAGFRSRLEGWRAGGSRMHNVVHLWVGGAWPDTAACTTRTGSMVVATSPNDPVFFLHHCFVDKLWAEWQELQKQRVRDRQLPPESQPHYEPRQGGPSGHNLLDAMYPWEWVTPASVLDLRRMGYTYDSLEDAAGTAPTEPGHDHHHLTALRSALATPTADRISPFLF